MTSLDDVARLASALPGVTEGTSYGNRAWRVGKRLFVWERPLRTADLEAIAANADGDAGSGTGPIVGVRVDDLDDKDALLQAGHPGLFTVPHFDGYPSLLIELDAADPDMVEELVVDAWLCRAPRRAVASYLEERGRTG